ncbi:hypothetical protein E4O04_08895 [Treponema sp. OMZ 799]|uniref:hypothetical protein n=1 Tax=Treponema sp. OMZ 799 TaxID=2563668 RepID=UPI0020A2ECBD|nr:hypothetical protein [Treponema sp. OMZ 799]UTC78108.1 hypothetical protein E4O04_08895 [Treponema sp. OMZ 799]
MAVARYEINGKFNKSAVNQAQISLAKLQKSVAGIAGSLKAVIIAKVMQVGAAAINGVTEAFKEQEMQLARLNTSVKTNSNLTAGAFKRLQAEADKLTKSGASIFSGEEVTKNQAYLSFMKLNESQINKVMKAATDLSSTGVMPLDQAVKTLSKTYSGNAGKLKELNPAIANLTEAQLKNGEAVSIIAEQYKGMNEAMANTEAGKARQVENTFDDLKKTIGEIILSIKNISFSYILTPLSNITNWLQKNKDNFINFFRHLPEIAMLSFSILDKMMKKVFTFDFLWLSFKHAVTIIGTLFGSLLAVLISTVGAVANIIWQPLKYSFEIIIYGIKQSFYAVMNFFVDGLNDLLDKINYVRDFFGKEKIAKFEKWGKDDKKPPENKIWENIKGGFKNLGDTIVNSASAVSETVKDAGADYGNLFKEEFGEFSGKFENIMSKKPEKKEVEGGAEGEETAPPPQKKTYETAPFSELIDNVKNAGGAIGWIGNVAEKAAMSGNPLVIVVELLKIVLEGLIEIIGPVLNSILAPLFGMLRVIGKFLGIVLNPLLRLLEPILRPLIKAFLFLYNNVLVPIGNGLIFMFNLIHNAFAAFINGISTLVSIVTFGMVNLGRASYRSLNEGKLEKITDTDLSMEGRAVLKLGGASGAQNAAGGVSAAVAAKPTEINIHFDHSFVNGDAREIALRLREEIKEAEKMGY